MRNKISHKSTDNLRLIKLGTAHSGDKFKIKGLHA